MILAQRNSYRLEERGGFFYVISNEARYCPVCHNLLYRSGTRQRVWRVSEDEKRILIILRLYCESCDKTHRELPDCIVPYKRYGAQIIEDIVVSNEPDQNLPCPPGTVRRLRDWWDAVKVLFLNVLLTLTEIYHVEFGNPPAFCETVRAVANSNRWCFAH
jgi:hypothetical protein